MGGGAVGVATPLNSNFYMISRHWFIEKKQFSEVTRISEVHQRVINKEKTSSGKEKTLSESVQIESFFMKPILVLTGIDTMHVTHQKVFLKDLVSIHRSSNLLHYMQCPVFLNESIYRKQKQLRFSFQKLHQC